MILCSFLGSPTPSTAGSNGLCTSCGVVVSFLPLCSPSPPWSGHLSLQNSPALAAVGEWVPLTPTQPSGSPHSQSHRGPRDPRCSTDTAHQKLEVVFGLKVKSAAGSYGSRPYSASPSHQLPYKGACGASLPTCPGH